MKFPHIPKLRIGNLIADKAIIQGGMGIGISLSGLASAVANEGGIGVIAAAGIGMLEPDFKKDVRQANKVALKKEIIKAKSKTDGLIGVNIMVALSDFNDLLLTAFDTPVDCIFVGAGLPLSVPRILTPERMRTSKIKIIPIVSSARAAKIIFKSWEKYNCTPDAFVVEGPKAGGHLGFKKEQLIDSDFALEKLVPETIEVVKIFENQFDKKIPVIAAGGIYTGSDIYKSLEMGASGVQMATRFVGTRECDADEAFKEAYIEADQNDLRIINSPVGLPGRALKNTFLADVDAGEKKPFSCPWQCLRTCNVEKAPYCIALALKNAMEGKLLNGFAFAGENAYRVNKIISVHELMETIEKEFNQAYRWRTVKKHFQSIPECANI